jgi:hypothetical protein
MRIGAQPFEAQYKTSVLATGDFAGVHLTSTFAPWIKGRFTYAQIEESSTGPRDGFIRGEDFAIITSLELSPVKGLDLRPIFSYAQLVGPTSTSTRQNRAGIGGGAASFPTAGAGFSKSAVEEIFTIAPLVFFKYRDACWAIMK